MLSCQVVFDSLSSVTYLDLSITLLGISKSFSPLEGKCGVATAIVWTVDCCFISGNYRLYRTF